jgi:hypothetical protein
MSDPEIEFFVERALLASKAAADGGHHGDGQGVGVLARLADRLPGLTLSEMLWNSLPSGSPAAGLGRVKVGYRAAPASKRARAAEPAIINPHRPAKRKDAE